MANLSINEEKQTNLICERFFFIQLRKIPFKKFKKRVGEMKLFESKYRFNDAKKKNFFLDFNFLTKHSKLRESYHEYLSLSLSLIFSHIHNSNLITIKQFQAAAATHTTLIIFFL